jgi:hypothetical protein
MGIAKGLVDECESQVEVPPVCVDEPSKKPRGGLRKNAKYLVSDLADYGLAMRCSQDTIFESIKNIQDLKLSFLQIT